MVNDTEKSFVLPGEISFALMTRRPELAGLLRQRIERGEPLSNEEMLGIADAAVEIVKIQAEVETKIAKIKAETQHICGHLSGGINILNRLAADIDDIGR